MVDIAPRGNASSPPDRRLLSQLTQDPKIIRYLENLYFDIATVGPENLNLLIDLINAAAEVASAAQSTANRAAQGFGDLDLLIASVRSLASDVITNAQAIADQSTLIQGEPQQIQALRTRLDELEVQLLENRPPVAAAAYAPTLIAVTAAYTVPAALSSQPRTVLANAATIGFTVTLPSAPLLLQLVNIKKVDASANAVVVNGGAINIDGGLTVSIGSQYTNLQVQFNGTTWDVL